MKLRREKGGRKEKSSLYKSETNLCKMWCGLMLCVGQWEKCHSVYIKKDIWMSL